MISFFIRKKPVLACSIFQWLGRFCCLQVCQTLLHLLAHKCWLCTGFLVSICLILRYSRISYWLFCFRCFSVGFWFCCHHCFLFLWQNSRWFKTTLLPPPSSQNFPLPWLLKAFVSSFGKIKRTNQSPNIPFNSKICDCISYLFGPKIVKKGVHEVLPHSQVFRPWVSKIKLLCAMIIFCPLSQYSSLYPSILITDTELLLYTSFVSPGTYQVCCAIWSYK